MPLTDMDKKNLGLKNRGYLYERTKHCKFEKAFAEAWQHENEAHRNLLQQLFNEGWSSAHEVSASERFVAATVVQWLGTNVGFSFLLDVVRKQGWRLEEVPPTPPPKPTPKNPYAKRKIVK